MWSLRLLLRSCGLYSTLHYHRSLHTYLVGTNRGGCVCILGAQLGVSPSSGAILRSYGERLVDRYGMCGRWLIGMFMLSVMLMLMVMVMITSTSA